MTTTGFGIPGAPGMMPGAAPAPAAMAPQAGFILDIPPDPTWEPFDTTDVLDKDGIYQCRISKESGRNDANKSQGVFLTLEVQDEDARGKILSRFLPDPRTAKGNVWFLWRGLLRSITGSLDGARQGMRYQPGMFVNQLVYVKTERSYRDERMSTDIDSWVTQTDWANAVQANKHRWPARQVQQQGAGGVGALPGGLPGGFPGMPGAAPPVAPMVGMGLPGAPGPAAPVAPQPGAAPFAAPPVAPAAVAPAPAPVAAPAAPPPVAPPAATAPAPAAPGQPFSFAQFPGMPAPPPVAGTNGAPAPTTAAGIAGSFPGMPQQPR